MFVKLIYSFLPIFIRFPKLDFCGVLPCIIYKMSKFVWIVLADATRVNEISQYLKDFQSYPKGAAAYLCPHIRQFPLHGDSDQHKILYDTCIHWKDPEESGKLCVCCLRGSCLENLPFHRFPQEILII